jgi:hypothetical protein
MKKMQMKGRKMKHRKLGEIGGEWYNVRMGKKGR